MPLHVIGLGVAAPAVLDEVSLRAIQLADLVMGSARQIDTVRAYLSESQRTEILPKLVELPSYLVDGVKVEGPHVVLLASGDPLFYGIGKWVAKTFPQESANAIHYYPAISSIQAACHRMGWSLQDVAVLSLHGRPLESLKTRLPTNRRLIVLTDDNSNPYALAKMCIETGFNTTVITVCEAMGYAEERIRTFTVKELIEANVQQGSVDAINVHPPNFHSLNVCCLEVEGECEHLPLFPGIEDRHLITDRASGKGMITKREVRLNVLSMMAVAPDDVIWDVGAGCGGVAVELSFWAPTAQVFAIEHHPDRLRCLRANQMRFGVVQNLHIVTGRAPEALESLPQPDKVFVGGSGGELATILAHCWQRLPDGGVLVASAVTDNTRAGLNQFYQLRKSLQDSVIATSEIAVSRGEALAGDLIYRPKLPVRLFQFSKSSSGDVAPTRKEGE